jgi:L-fucose/D-arabinose isomerase
MAMIVRDLMVGNPALKRKGLAEEALGHNAILAGFQGQRAWTDHFPNGDFLETILNSSFDWTGIRQPYVVATENDALNGVSMLFGHLLTGTSQIFSDVRTYWSPEAVQRVTGWKPEGAAKDGFIHLINSGATTMDGTGKQKLNGKPAMKPYWEITAKEAGDCLDATSWRYADLRLLPRRRLLLGLPHRRRHARHHEPPQPGQGRRPGPADSRRRHRHPARRVHDKLDKRTNETWPTTWFVPRLTGTGPFKDVYSVMAAWGANHGAVCYGHVGADLITLASILRIPVCMHNVAPDQVYRPSYWNAFGMDEEGSDYRACEALGPMYK